MHFLDNKMPIVRNGLHHVLKLSDMCVYDTTIFLVQNILSLANREHMIEIITSKQFCMYFDNNGNSLLMLSCFHENQSEIALALIQSGMIDCDHLNNDCANAFSFACISRMYSVLHALLTKDYKNSHLYFSNDVIFNELCDRCNIGYTYWSPPDADKMAKMKAELMRIMRFRALKLRCSARIINEAAKSWLYQPGSRAYYVAKVDFESHCA